MAKARQVGAFKIEDGIAAPIGCFRRAFPFGEMKVGQSFLVPIELKDRTVSAASWYGKRHQMKFSIRKTDAGYRCWRVA